MKKTVYSLLVAAAVASVSASCDESLLTIPQKGVYSESDYYKTDEDCKSALAAVYSSILHTNAFFVYDVCINSLLGDDCYKTSSGYKADDYHSFMLSTYDDTHRYVRFEFENLFKTVYRCNLVIDNFEEGTSTLMKQAVAEAKTMRAWAYIKIISRWGTPPLVDHVPRTGEDMRLPNSTKEALWTWVIRSLDEAIGSGAMESKSSVEDRSKVRATKEFAMALKGKAQVFSGDYSGAKTTLKSLMDTRLYALVPSSEMGKNS